MFSYLIVLIYLIESLNFSNSLRSPDGKEADSPPKRNPSPRERAEQKLTIMCIAMIVIFLLGHLPGAFAFGRVYRAMFGPLALQTPHYKLYSRITHAISTLVNTYYF